MVSTRVKTLALEFDNVKEFLKRKASFPIDVRRSKTFLLKLPKSSFGLLSRKVAGCISGRASFKTPEEILRPGRVSHPFISTGLVSSGAK